MGPLALTLYERSRVIRPTTEHKNLHLSVLKSYKARDCSLTGRFHGSPFGRDRVIYGLCRCGTSNGRCIRCLCQYGRFYSQFISRILCIVDCSNIISPSLVHKVGEMAETYAGIKIYEAAKAAGLRHFIYSSLYHARKVWVSSSFRGNAY